MQFILFIVLICCYTTANSEENHSPSVSSDLKSISESALLKKAKSLKDTVLSNNSPCNIDEQLDLDAHLFIIIQGNKIAEIHSIKDVQYVLGVAASSGYREYKTTGDYENDILAFVCIPV